MRITALFLAVAWAGVTAAVLPAGAEIVIGNDGPLVIDPGQRIVVGSRVVRPASPPYAPPDTDPAGDFTREKTDVLVFMNRDRLHGMLEAVDPPGGGLRWKHAGASNAIAFALSGLSHVKLAARPAEGQVTHKALVHLTNGDLLAGDIEELNGTNLVLNTWYAGRVCVRRNMLAAIEPSVATSSVVYEGPGDIAGWLFPAVNAGRKSWSLRNGALSAIDPVPIGRNIENLPDQADIEFEADWRGQPYFFVSVFSDNLRQYSGNCYVLRITGPSVYLYRYDQNAGSQNMGNVSIAQFVNDGNQRARFNILVDRKTARLMLTINGRLVQQWTDAGGFAGKGNGLVFQPQNAGELRISRIRVSKWDGRTPKEPQAAEKGDQDLMRFANADKVSGTLQQIVQGKASFVTSYATLDVPLERIDRVDFSEGKVERARRNAGDVLAHFNGRGRVTLRLARLGDGRLEGDSENVGTLALPLAACRLLELNIYEEKPGEEELGGS